MTLPALVLAALATVSFGLSAWQCLVARRFPLHRRRSDVPASLPAVSILKPLKGCDAETRACLRSWLTQDYPGPVEVLFGVAVETDPVCQIVRELIAGHPGCRAELVTGLPRLGPNAKASTLAHLETRARHGVLVVSDADVRAPADFLSQAASELQDPAVGLVHAFYRMTPPADASLAMRLEALAVNVDFWSQVLQARSLGPVRFALGAAVMVRREGLEAAGGFGSLTGFLADDYQLGQAIANAGARLALTPVVVDCCAAPQSWQDVWAHQARWARTICACRPWAYFFSILGNATLWPLLWMLAWPNPAGVIVGGVFLLGRMVAACWLERRLTDRGSLVTGPLAWLKDLMQVGVWATAFLGRRVTWAGEELRLGAGGRLERRSTES